MTKRGDLAVSSAAKSIAAALPARPGSDIRLTFLSFSKDPTASIRAGEAKIASASRRVITCAEFYYTCRN